MASTASSWPRAWAWCLAAVALQALGIAHPAAAKDPTINAAACPQAGTGVFAGKKWSKCGRTTVSDGSLRMVVDADLEGEGAGMKPRTDAIGKRCDVGVDRGVVSVSAAGFRAAADLDGENEDSIVRTSDGRMFVNATSAKDNIQIALEFDARQVVQSAQAKVRGRMLTCGAN